MLWTIGMPAKSAGTSACRPHLVLRCLQLSFLFSSVMPPSKEERNVKGSIAASGSKPEGPLSVEAIS